MREIRFRNFCQVCNEMVNVWEPKAYKEGLVFQCPNHDVWTETQVMQLTGLKDKNGVDIYEGDIISAEKNCMFHDGRVNHVVEFFQDQFCVNGYSLFQSVNHFDAEVIGNKYESPKLLEK